MSSAPDNPVRLFADSRGVLGVSEFGDLPFVPHRFFWLSGVGVGENRAGHGHKTCHQFLFCLQGSLRAVVEDRNGPVSDQRLMAGDNLHLLPRQWLDLYEFEPNTVLGVYASHPYDYADYIVTKEEL